MLHLECLGAKALCETPRAAPTKIIFVLLFKVLLNIYMHLIQDPHREGI